MYVCQPSLGGNMIFSAPIWETALLLMDVFILVFVSLLDKYTFDIDIQVGLCMSEIMWGLALFLVSLFD